MTKFEALKSLSDVKKFSELIFDLIGCYDTSEKFTGLLEQEVTEHGLQTLESIAQSNYPLFFEGKQ
jgi:hypothetical protein